EFNARFGDPETQAVLPLVKNDLYTLLKACVDGDLHKHRLEVSDKASCVVIMASGGYPGKYKTGCEITGLDLAEDVFIYHAGTVKKDNTFFTAGGRVLAVSAQAKTLSEAIDKAYMEVDKISFDNCVFRRDIGKDCGAIL
ncbi:MAG: phosphoribosylamine--glycine ligase, partial [Clostridiaceae bacterium]|nr:phosphoribosylamine--glycine ligase [Clostridiaceae bacterium]